MMFVVNSSDGKRLYNVKFNFDCNKVFVSCDCKAGVVGKNCKHKTGLLNGNLGLLFDSFQSESLENLRVRLEGSNIMNIVKELDLIERQLADLKKLCDMKKIQLEKAFKGVE